VGRGGDDGRKRKRVMEGRKRGKKEKGKGEREREGEGEKEGRQGKASGGKNSRSLARLSWPRMH
jgi:hypothetical protein